MQKSWDVKNIRQQLARCASSLHREDGFTAWTFKEELYEIYFYLEEILEETNFGKVELDYIKEQKQKKLIKVLSND